MAWRIKTEDEMVHDFGPNWRDRDWPLGERAGAHHWRSHKDQILGKEVDQYVVNLARKEGYCSLPYRNPSNIFYIATIEMIVEDSEIEF